ncbi:hypothetical protein T439DRAFT_197320 [Meredithblackwellia eburnea MCA 4105]
MVSLSLDVLPLTSFLTMLLLVPYIYKSYNSYIAHGPGGLGQHWKGWATSWIFTLAIWSAGMAIHSTDTLFLERLIENGENERWLRDEDIPVREGLPPVMLPFPIPQRHLVESENIDLAAAQLEIFTNLAQKYPHHLRFGCSKLEHDGPALFARQAPHAPSMDKFQPNPRLAPLGELMHIHLCPFSFAYTYTPNFCSPFEDNYAPLPSPAPQSVHLTLSPGDAIAVIEKGWAVRHPASGNPPRPIPPLPAGLVLVFAPRDQVDLAVLSKMCEASAAFGAGIRPPIRA